MIAMDVNRYRFKMKTLVNKLRRPKSTNKPKLLLVIFLLKNRSERLIKVIMICAIIHKDKIA